ncbi:MAG: hypothetical protein AB8I08_36760 [Sandaracinaceae bacterium]
MRRIGFSATWLATLFVIGAFVSAWLGWIELRLAFDIGLGAAGLGLLWLVVWLPWDLYFAARKVSVDQDDSVAAGIEVPERDRRAARRMAPRLLALCLGLHISAASVIAAITWASEGRTGYYFAGFFLLAIGLRPVGALYQHARARLRELGQRARYPREDVFALRDRVNALEAALATERERVATTETTLARLETDTQTRMRGFDGKVDRVLGELERSVSRLTADRELLNGIRAFVRVIRAS